MATHVLAGQFKQVTRLWPVVRAAAVVSAIAVVVSGVTFASLQSQQAVLTGNTIQSATADLRIGTSASTFAASRTGFSFDNVVPGGPAMPTDGNNFYLKNYGTATLNLKVAIASTPTNAQNVDLTKVSIILTRVDTGAQQTLSLKSLIDAQSTGGTAITDALNPSVVAQYKLRAVMDNDAFSGSSASVGAIDLVFSGAATV